MLNNMIEKDFLQETVSIEILNRLKGVSVIFAASFLQNDLLSAIAVFHGSVIINTTHTPN